MEYERIATTVVLVVLSGLAGCGPSWELRGVRFTDARDPVACIGNFDHCAARTGGPSSGRVFLGNDQLIALDPQCSVLDENRRVVVPPGRCEWSNRRDFAAGRYTVRVEARCQPPSEHPLDPGEYMASATVDLPAPERRYLRADQQLAQFPGAASRSPHSFDRAGRRSLPPNSVLDVVRHWPDDAGGCTRAIVRVVDAGGVVQPGEFFVATLDQLDERPGQGPTAAQFAQRERDAAERRQQTLQQAQADAARAEAEEEARTGRCGPTRSAALQSALQVWRGVFGSDNLDVESNELRVLSPAGATLTHREPLRGTYHVLVAAFAPVQLDVLDRRGNAVAVASPYEGVLAAGRWSSASRTFIANTLDEHTLSVRGNGCALIMGLYAP